MSLLFHRIENNIQESKRSTRRTLPNRFTLNKRRRFVFVAAILTLGLFFIQRISVEARLWAFGIYGIFSYILCAWSLYRDLRGIAWFTNLILPTMYPLAVGLFYFLLPQHEITRIIVALIFGMSMYALLLTTNIFAVASIRTIQLLRAARAVGFLLTILTSALLFHFIFSLRVGVAPIALLVFIVAFPLFLFGVWSYTLSDRFSDKELAYSLIGGLAIMEVAVAISFWLVDVSLVSIFLAMIVYVVLGLMQHELEDRLFVRTLQEYVGFGILVFAIITSVVFTRWIG